MADAEPADAEDAPPKAKSRKPLIIGAALALLLGGGGFFAAYAGLIPGFGGAKKHEAADPATPVPGGLGAFVALDPMALSLGPGTAASKLRLQAALEVAPEFSAEVSALRPRVMDVLASYLRALDIAELEDPAAMIRLRAQMLRRIQLVTGEGRVRDLLITQFMID